MTHWLLRKGIPQERVGIILALLATLFYSLKPIFIKLIYLEDVSSLSILTWRMIISLPIYIFIGVYIWRRTKQKSQETQEAQSSKKGWLWKTAAIGIIGYYFAALFDLLGLQYISSQLARLILFTYPTLVAVLGWVIFKDKLTKSVISALVLSYLGLSFIFLFDFRLEGEKIALGSFLMFLSVLAFSLYVLLSKSLIDQVGSSTFTVVAMLASSVCIAAHLFIEIGSLQEIALNMKQFNLIALMTILTTVIPSFLIAEAIGLIGPQRSAIAGTFGPVATSIFAVFVLNEVFGLYHFVGLVMVVFAIYVMQKEKLEKAA